MTILRIPTRTEASETIRERTFGLLQKHLIQSMIDDFNDALETGSCTETNNQIDLRFKLTLPSSGIAGMSDQQWEQTRDYAFTEFNRLLKAEGFETKHCQWTTPTVASIQISWKV